MGGFSKRAGSGARRTALVVMGLMLVVAMLVPVAPAFAAAPAILTPIPASGPVGTTVTITGASFGTFTQDSRVTFNGVKSAPTVWREALIITTVPAGATTGPVIVSTTSGDSNPETFEVTATPIPPTPTPTPLTPPAQTWYLAEGSTAYGFDSYILIQNTTTTAANVQVTYNTALGNVSRPQLLGVPASGRVTLHVNEELPNMDFSTTLAATQPVVCERAMYWNNRVEGTESIGVTLPSPTWYLAEGYTDNGYQTYVLVQNPLTSAAHVNVTYMTSKGLVQKATVTVGAGQRYTIDVNKDVPGCEVSARVDSDQPVICERSMYWDNKRGGHDSIGVTKGSKTWYMAEGSTAWGFRTYLLIQNPTTNWANVDVTYNTAGGPQAKPGFLMPPQSRKTIFVNDDVENNDTSIWVTSDQEVIAERSMYWDNGTGKAGHETVAMPAPATSVFLAEGSTAWGFDTYVCIQNPNDVDVTVNLTFMTLGGAVAVTSLPIVKGSRITAHLNQLIPNVDVATQVQCDKPIMAERAMYWNNKGGGHSSIGWTR